MHTRGVDVPKKAMARHGCTANTAKAALLLLLLK